MSRRLWANNARCALGADIVTTGAVATLALETGKGALFPSPSAGNWFILSVEDSSKNVECFKITSRTGDILTVGGAGSDRAQEGTTARTFTAATSVVGIRPTKGAFEAIDDHIEDTAGAHAATAISTSGAYSEVQAYLTGLAASVTALTGALTAPAGTRMVFHQTSAPTGWVKETGGGYNDKALRIVTGSVGSGGATDFATVFGSGKSTGSYTLQIADIPAHSHGVTDPGHYHSVGPLYTGGSQGINGNPEVLESYTTLNTSTNVTGISIQNAGGGGGHSHTLSLDLAYHDIIIAQKS